MTREPLMPPLRPCLKCGKPSPGSYCETHRTERGRYRERVRERPGTTARSYGWVHQQERERLLPGAYGQPCPRCGQPMWRGQELDLGHTDQASKRAGLPGDRIEHALCNRGGR